jgi:multiple sugar transport system permease protein
VTARPLHDAAVNTTPRAARSPARIPRRLHPTLLGLFWVSPWLIGFTIFFALPIALSFYYSLTDYPLLEPPLYIGLDNYRNLLTDDLFGVAIGNTLIYALIAIPAGTIIALIVAGLLNQRVRGVGFFRTAVFVPTLVPIVASAMIWLWLFNGEYGLINQALAAAGVQGPNWLQSRFWAMAAIIIMSLWIIGQPVVIYLAALQDVPRSLYEAASLDGMGPIRRFWHVAMPVISPIILFNVIILTIDAWQVFAVPYIMTEGGPDRATYFYSHYLYDKAFRDQQMGYASAMAWVQFLIILALTGLMFLVSRRLVQRGFA